MSPTSREIVSNKPLAGSELAKIMLRDFTQMLEGDGFFGHHIAYGRVSYEIRYVLHMDNPMMKTGTNWMASRPAPKDRIVDHPELSALESLPLRDPTTESLLESKERHRDITSPNAARVEHGIAITVQHIDRSDPQNPHLVDRQLQYPEGSATDKAPVDTDVTETVKKELGIA